MSSLFYSYEALNSGNVTPLKNGSVHLDRELKKRLRNWGKLAAKRADTREFFDLCGRVISGWPFCALQRQHRQSLARQPKLVAAPSPVEWTEPQSGRTLYIHDRYELTPKADRCWMLTLLVTGCKPSTPAKAPNLSTLTPSTPAPFFEPEVPDSLKVEPTEALSFFAHARGFQIYECRAKKDAPDQYEWALKAPEADLFDANGKKMGHHYAGPTWESEDGSKIVGEMKAREPSPDASAIPWLLLTVKSHEGQGIMSPITSVQRLETTGGKAPAEGCNQSTAGQELRVPYTAVYYFYSPKP